MRLIDTPGDSSPALIWSASDLTSAAECEFAWLRKIDARLDRCERVADPEDAMLARAGALGDAHEQRMLERYRREFPGAVREVPRAPSSDAEALAAAVALTHEALHDPEARVVYQAAFSTPEFVGFADFLFRDAPGLPWVVQDTKLARRAKVTALMQLGAYVDQLDRLGVPRANRVELLLGDGTTSRHRVDDILPVFELRLERIRALIADRRLDARASLPPIAWGDERGDLAVFACGRCATCEIEVEAQRDLLLVAGMRPLQRRRLRDAGITTIDALAASAGAPESMSAETFSSLQTQAALQLESEAVARESAEIPHAAGEASTPAAPAIPPVYEVVMPTALAALPTRDPGDLFFDFEGDPLYTEGGADRAVWGIDYLFGWVDTAGTYSALWAHDFAEERAAFELFLDVVAQARRANPGMHIYHYAPYEPTHLLQMAARYGVREADVDTLLREGVFVDLYPIVRRALRVGSRSYSIKKLEPLYMGAQVRTADVKRGDDSIVRYVEAMAARDAGDDETARVILDDLADYNRYDCVSTLRLRDWLVDRAREAHLQPARDEDPREREYRPSPRAETLQLRAAEADRAMDAEGDAASGGLDASAVVAAGGSRAEGVSPTDSEVLRLAAAAIDYYPREAKTFWAGHFARLREPLSFWEDTRDVVAIDRDRSRVLEDWRIPEGGRVLARRLDLRGALAPGTRLSAGGEVQLVYALPAPFVVDTSPRWIHVARTVRIDDVLDDGVVLDERAVDGQTWRELPIAIAPGAPPAAGNQQGAIDEWADQLIADVASGRGFPADPATDVLRAGVPRTRTGALSRVPGASMVDDITATILDLDRSYVAVQGPPGTGKTYVGSHVIAKLVAEHGYSIGVVAQSHAVVENMLDRIVAAGVPPRLVGKALKDPGRAGEVSFTALSKSATASDGLANFLADNAATGCVVGGTAWDFAHPQRVARRALDLLVIDEAGQFSLAATIAVSVAASRLLLLGDPQQLPQVSQGTHPEPVDGSALGWVMRGADVIADDHGYFLERSWRMHPRVSRAVSRLSYDSRLRSHPEAELRHLDGVAPGVHAVPVRHRGDTTASPDEAERVVAIVRDLMGRAFTEASGGTRPLGEADIIVVTPYNAQQVEVEQALAAAGFTAIPVGTVDKFQGREAVCAIVSLAASSGRDAPRGLEFLLLQNRLNVAVSRAQWAAYLVYSPALLDDLPHTPEGVARLAGFAGLLAADEGRIGYLAGGRDEVSAGTGAPSVEAGREASISVTTLT